MTLHASKGLEFPVVFILGCERPILPLELDNYSANPQEERRLFYVGMTRTQSQLYLTYSKRRSLFGKTWKTSICPFLEDIDTDLIYKDNPFESRRPKPKEEKTQQLHRAHTAAERMKERIGLLCFARFKKNPKLLSDSIPAVRYFFIGKRFEGKRALGRRFHAKPKRKNDPYDKLANRNGNLGLPVYTR